MKKKILVIMLIISVILVLCCSVRSEEKYVASKKSPDKVFHNLDCFHVKRILPENKIYFGNCQEAFDAGYRPCKDCNPCLIVFAVNKREKLAVTWGRIKVIEMQ